MAGSPKILLIEDDFMIRELYLTAFTDAGFESVVTGDAEETYKKLETYKPDIVFIDIMLPNVSGIEILKELRGNPRHGCQTVRILMLTNLDQENLAKESMDNKADGYIIKADTVPNDLIKVVKSVATKNS